MRIQQNAEKSERKAAAFYVKPPISLFNSLSGPSHANEKNSIVDHWSNHNRSQIRLISSSRNGFNSTSFLY